MKLSDSLGNFSLPIGVFLKFKKNSANQKVLFCDVTPGAIIPHSFNQIETFSSEFSQN
jgi:hypothetical protein